MALSGALNNALSGLKVTQAGLDVVSRNVANSSTIGYSKQVLNQSVADYGGIGFGVKAGDIERVLNEHLTKQLRGELTGSGYAQTMQGYLERLEMSFGAPGAGNGLESRYSEFNASLERLIASPENPSVRSEFVQNAKLLADSLNSLTANVQELRRQAETEIDGSVSRINEILKGIAGANQKIASSPKPDPQVLDQRDQLINELAGLMEVNALPPGPDGTVSVLSRSGTLLVSDVPMTLTFENRQATVTPDRLYEEGELGTIVLSGPGRPPVDLIQEGAFRDSGKIGALLELRDRTLVEVQNSLDAVADALARSLSTYEVGSTTAEAPAIGRDLSPPPLQYGDELRFSYTDGTSTKTIVFVPTNGAAPDLSAYNDRSNNVSVVGIDFSNFEGDPDAVAAAIQAKLQDPRASGGFNLGDFSVTWDATASGGAGAFQFREADGTDALAITGLSARATATDPSGGQLAVPLFNDGGQPYVGGYDFGRQQQGFAGSIRVNQAILDNTKLLSQYGPDVPLGDSARLQDMAQRLKSVEIRTPNGSIAASDPASSVNLGTFLSRVISTQAARASAANRQHEAQSQVVTQLEERAARVSGVSVDEEMTKLLGLQMAYQANAKVVQTYEEMLNQLMGI